MKCNFFFFLGCFFFLAHVLRRDPHRIMERNCETARNQQKRQRGECFWFISSSLSQLKPHPLLIQTLFFLHSSSYTYSFFFFLSTLAVLQALSGTFKSRCKSFRKKIWSFPPCGKEKQLTYQLANQHVRSIQIMKKKFSKEDDDTLRTIVPQFGRNIDWVEVSDKLPGHSGKLDEK